MALLSLPSSRCSSFYRCSPFNPAGPTFPLNPFGPCGPTGPDGPGSPCSPLSPSLPSQPGCPIIKVVAPEVQNAEVFIRANHSQTAEVESTPTFIQVWTVAHEGTGLLSCEEAGLLVITTNTAVRP